MSPDPELERLLRDARAALPGPGEAATGRARAGALRAVRRHPRRSVGIAAASITGFAIALAVGIGIGALVTPSGNAAKDAVGLGFLPVPGWTAFQTGNEVSPVFQTVAIASNVPLAREDQTAGLADPSGLPYATLQTLPPNGVVIVASFARAAFYDGGFKSDWPTRELPLDLADATRYVQYGTEVRPEDPLGQWEIRSVINGHLVDVILYFGTATPSAALRAEASRQLDRLVVQRVRVPGLDSGPHPAERAAPATATAAVGSGPDTVIERTLSCATGMQAGAHVIYVGGQTGNRVGKTFETLAQAYVTTAGSRVASRPNQYQPQLVAMTAGYPAEPPLTSGGLGYNGKLCAPVRARVPFTKHGLAGGIANQIGEESQCFPPGKVLVHFRVAFIGRPAVKVDRKSRFYSAVGRIKVGQLAIRSPKGKPIAYLDVSDSGTARGFTAGGCA